MGLYEATNAGIVSNIYRLVESVTFFVSVNQALDSKERGLASWAKRCCGYLRLVTPASIFHIWVANGTALHREEVVFCTVMNKNRWWS